MGNLSGVVHNDTQEKGYISRAIVLDEKMQKALEIGRRPPYYGQYMAGCKLAKGSVQ